MKDIGKKDIVIIHGTYGKPDINWFPWLKEELSYLGVNARVPAFPSHQYQNISAWRDTFRDQVGSLHSDMILIGHSLGAGFVLNLLEQSEAQISASFFVAGFTGKLGLPEYDPPNETFVCRPFDWGKIRDNAGQAFVLHGDNDPYVPLDRGENLAHNLQVPLTVINNGGHLNSESGWSQFPLLLQLLKGFLSSSRESASR